ncbi:CHASE2 domain-containing protein [Mastigocladopsis repens]|uniref:CHASE2 domain-containing protein n=1 Tax=Mastigocladopsis repens TaxID=221287 RepID=UPI0002E77A84|nr:CHASE2 domain-containing protein [Mastigocladopsis repens]
MAPNQSSSSIEIFISYAQEDKKLLEQFTAHLSSLKREGVINAWHDGEINAGTEGAKQIEEHLNSADVILLLLSSDFIDSEEHWQRDVTRAMDRHNKGEARVIPVLLRPFDWKIKQLDGLQALPRNGEAITSKSWSNHDDAFKEVAEDIRKVVEELIPRQLEKVPEETSDAVTTSIPKPQWLPLLLKLQSFHWLSLLKFLGISTGLTTLVVFMRLCGIFQASELWFFDQMMQFQPTESQDDRLLVIEVTKEDIDKQEGIKRGSLTDKTLLTLLKTLLKYPQNQPKTIGLDIYRDFATETKEFSQPENKKLSNLLKTESRIIAVCNIGDLSQNNKGTAPPPEIPTKRLGFSDFLSDSEGIVRRQILSIETPKSSPCWSSKEPVSNAFSLELAQHYLGKQYEEIKDRSIRLRLGDTTFDLLDGRHRGGYSFWTDLEGYQVLLNYRVSCSEKKKNDCSPQYVAERVTLDDVNKSDFLTKYSLKDKIVLIGVSDYSYEAPWFTPFSSKGHAPIPGVIIQAQMVSQILSAVDTKNPRPLLRVLPIWYEILWILFWSLIGGAIALLRFSSIPRLRLSTKGLIISGGVVFISLYCSSLIYFITPVKYWVPFVPSALTFLGTGGVVLYRGFNPQKS